MDNIVKHLVASSKAFDGTNYCYFRDMVELCTDALDVLEFIKTSVPPPFTITERNDEEMDDVATAGEEATSSTSAPATDQGLSTRRRATRGTRPNDSSGTNVNVTQIGQPSQSEQQQALQSYLADQKLARMVVLALCDNERRKLISGITDPFRAMSELRDIYASDAPSNQYRLKKKLARFKCDPAKTMSDNIAAFQVILNDLVASGVETPNAEKCRYLLESLPDEWAYTKKIWLYASSKQGPVYKDLRIKILNEELDEEVQDTQKPKVDTLTPNALVTGQHNKSGKRYQPYPKKDKRAQFTAQPQRHAGNGTSKSYRKCKTCGKTGHSTHECRFVLKQSNQSALAFVLQANHEEREEKREWVLDSGSSAHITGNRLLLTEVRKPTQDEPKFITPANGAAEPVQGVGKLKVAGTAKYLKTEKDK
jgi:hypothetical protein